MSSFRYVPAIAALLIAGLVSVGYLLVKQRFPVPFRDVYEVKVVLPSADGVAPGLGQPVNVAGVRVGTIAAADAVPGGAEVTLQIQRQKLARVHADGYAALRPITPLSDMRVELNPGSRTAPALREGATLRSSRNTAPVPLATLLSGLDGDTRAFFTTLVDGLGRTAEQRAPDLRRVLLSFGPTTAQLREVSESLAARRRTLARLVHNVSRVARAASSDGRLADLVVSGHRALGALRAEDASLRTSLARLPGALESGAEALDATGKLAGELQPAVRALTPSVRRLPGTIRTLGSLGGRFATTLRTEFRPLTREAQPLAAQAALGVRSTSALLPDLSRTVQRVQYLANSLAYNPPGKEEGGLFWGSWMIHNWNSLPSYGDAHGGIIRGLLVQGCDQIVAIDAVSSLTKLLTGSANVCPSVTVPNGSARSGGPAPTRKAGR
ncbi:MAG: MlaD family protein [Solirubrobacteraceae bacterium]